MSNNAKFAEEWNNIFKYQIRGSDLARPTKLFLMQALESVLDALHLNVDALKERLIDPMEIRGKFDSGSLTYEIKLCEYINHLFKISGESNNSFLYYDLINPSPKKTVHLLKYLLNYFLYYNMVKQEVVNEANNAIKDWQDVTTKINKLLSENESARIRENNINDELKEIKIRTPLLNAQITELQRNERELLADEELCKSDLKSKEALSLQLGIKVDQLKREIVSDREIQMLKETEEQLDRDICEIAEKENNLVQLNNNIETDIIVLKDNVNILETMLSMAPLNDALEIRSIEIKLKELLNQIDIKTLENKDVEIEIKMLEKEIEKLRKSYEMKGKLFKTTSEEQSNEILQLNNDLQELRKEDEKIVIQLRKLDELNAEQTVINENIPDMAKKILDLIKKY